MQNAIDWASVPKPRNEWQGKPAAMVSVGGTTGGIKGQHSLRASSESPACGAHCQTTKSTP